jgi:hypothetical protein
LVPRAPAGGGGVEGIVLGLDRAALACVAEAGEALGDESAHAGLVRGGQKSVGALGPEPVGRREAMVQLPREARIRQRGRLVHDRVGLGFEDGLAHSARLEQVERDRLRPERPYPLGFAWRPEGADHLVTVIDELRNEPGADRTARPRDEDSHRVLLSGISGHMRGLWGVTCMTPGNGRM